MCGASGFVCGGACIYIQICIRTYISICMRTYVRIYQYVCVHMCTYMYMYMCVCIHTGPGGCVCGGARGQAYWLSMGASYSRKNPEAWKSAYTYQPRSMHRDVCTQSRHEGVGVLLQLIWGCGGLAPKKKMEHWSSRALRNPSTLNLLPWKQTVSLVGSGLKWNWN